MALKQVDFFSHSFSRINSEKLIRTLPYEVPQKVYKINSSFLFQQILIEMLGMLRLRADNKRFFIIEKSWYYYSLKVVYSGSINKGH